MPRRRFMAGVAAALLGAVGVATADAATKRGPGLTCREDSNCVAGSRCRQDARGRRTCVCDVGLKACGATCIPFASCCKDRDCRSLDTACAKGTCATGVCKVRIVKNGTRCSGGVCCDGGCVPCCNGVGNCVPCQAASTCPGQDGACANRTCHNGFCGVATEQAGKVVGGQTDGNCKKSVCNASGGVIVVNDDADLPAGDGSQCTTARCSNGAPSHVPLAAGTVCDQNGGRRCNGSGKCVACLTASDCPGEDTECQHRVCDSGACGFGRTSAGTALSVQIAGDCKRIECDGLGGTIEVADDLDLPDGGNPCLQNLCVAGAPSHPPATLGTECGNGLVCDGEGNCDGCASATSCPGVDTECQTRTCVAGVCGIAYAAAGTAVSSQTTGDCKKDV